MSRSEPASPPTEGRRDSGSLRNSRGCRNSRDSHDPCRSRDLRNSRGPHSPHQGNTSPPDSPSHRPRRRFGQNFLHDAGVINRIIEAIDPQSQQHLLEIGPGHGALTTALADSGARLDCVEVDRDLAAALETRFASNPKVRVMQQDILKFDPATSGAAPRSLRIIGNLPYNIATPVLFHLLRSRHLIQDMVFMLQLEVVQRMTAAAGSRQYGRLGLMLQYHCEVERLFNVPAAAFSPRPKVMSSVVRLTPHQHPPNPAKDVEALATVIRTAFGQRRKTLKNSLKAILPAPTLDAIAIDLNQRPERLTLADYVLISDALTASQTTEPPQTV